MHRTFWPAAAAVIVAIIASGVWLAMRTPSSASGREMVLADDREPLIVETAAGPRQFIVEIADDPGERERGLMFRQDMPDDHGMLFVFEEQRQVGFWMKDTPMALDLLFIAQDGSVKAIEKGEPLSEAIISPAEPVRFVLEIKAGQAAANGIAVGDKAHHRVISQAPGVAKPVDG